MKALISRFLRGAFWMGILALSPGPALAGECKLGVMADLPVTMRGLRASVPVKVNGQDTSFWLDSGAFVSIMSKAKAIEFGLKLYPTPTWFYMIGIGGRADAQIATIKSLGIVGQELKDMQFLVGGSDPGNGLIGRNILGLADTEFDLANGSVKLIKPTDCKKSALAYWTAGKPFFTVPLIVGSNPHDHLFRLPVLINGKRIEAEFDTGAPTSLLSRHAAELAGIDLSAPGVRPSDGVSGFGRRVEKGWLASIASIAIGDEEILKAKIEVIDNSIGGDGGPDMLLGADFMLAHHIYVAREQRLIYFTYSGGKPFLTDAVADQADKPASAAAPAALPEGKRRVEAVTGTAAEPKTAEDYARRGNTELTGRRFKEAITDLSEAIRLSPDTASHYRDRARAHAANGDAALAAADIDKALTLEPGDGELLLVRARMRLGQKDKAGALADTQAAAKETPAASLAMLSVAQLFTQLGEPARGIALYGPVIAAHQADSSLGQMLNDRCWTRALANVELDAALDDCNRAIKRNGPQPNLLDSRGLVYFRKGDFKAAMADYDAALKDASDKAWSLYVRGLIRIALGQTEAGKADQTAARAARPTIADEAAAYGIGTAAK